MRWLIDLDALLDIFGTRDRDIYAKETIQEAIYDGTLDVYISTEPRKMGRWIANGDPLMLTCGNCGYSVMRYNNTPFCPNCGAKMEKIYDCE